MKKYTIAIAGSTARTTLCAETLKHDDRFEISWILTPSPKPIGRKKIITPNPLDNFAKKNELPVVYVNKKIDEHAKNEILNQNKIDFLLIVDFGYFIPNWLINLPKIAPLNIHPSELPKWRGSSPGQYSILFNDKKSAVTLMAMNNKFDQGPIIHQDFFDVSQSWTQQDYYTHAFEIMCNGLGEKIAKFAANSDAGLSSASKPQLEESPTITAWTLKKDQAFVPWEVVKIAMNGEEIKQNKDEPSNKPSAKNPQLSKLLTSALAHNKSLALTLERASKAFHPWPSLWTLVPTKKGEKRMKLLELEIKLATPETKSSAPNNIDSPNSINSQNKKLILKTVHIEGKNPTSWNEVKNSILK